MFGFSKVPEKVLDDAEFYIKYAWEFCCKNKSNLKCDEIWFKKYEETNAIGNKRYGFDAVIYTDSDEFYFIKNHIGEEGFYIHGWDTEVDEDRETIRFHIAYTSTLSSFGWKKFQESLFERLSKTIPKQYLHIGDKTGVITIP